MWIQVVGCEEKGRKLLNPESRKIYCTKLASHFFTSKYLQLQFNKLQILVLGLDICTVHDTATLWHFRNLVNPLTANNNSVELTDCFPTLWVWSLLCYTLCVLCEYVLRMWFCQLGS